jgi:glycosyltransferase involved in cell wall biosynthesis
MNIGVNARVLTTENMEGVARYIYETTRSMAIAHPDDRFILFFDRSVKVAFDFPANVTKVIVPVPARDPILWYIWFELLLPIYLKWYNIDVFYSGDGSLSLGTNVPTLLVTHDLAYIHHPDHISKRYLSYNKAYVPKFHQKASSIITVSHYVKNDVISKFGIDPSKIHVAYNAVHTQKKNTTSPEKNHKTHINHPYFIYVGSLHPRKNIIRLIDGFIRFKSMTNNDYKLVIAGRLAWKSDDIKQKLTSSPDIIYLGMVSETMKNELISKAVALAYISVFEGFGIPIIEAMRLGVPVITSSVTSMPEVAGDAALLVDPFDINSISSAMETLSNDKHLRADLIKKGNVRYPYFSWDKSGNIIYNELFKIAHSEKH